MRINVRLWTGVLLLIAAGCKPGVTFIRPEDQRVIDRAVVDYKPNFELKEYAHNLNVPTSLCVDPDGTMFIVEGGISGQPLHIFGRRIDTSEIEIYPPRSRVPFVGKPFKIYGPVGGIAAANGKLFVSHRDANDMGMITAFNYDGTHSTVVAEFPAQGDYGITDIAIHPGDGRLYFGVGPATNSGVVGTDNARWIKKHPNACDIAAVDLKLYGLKFPSDNPIGGVFSGGGTAVTAPFQPFNTNDKTRIKKAPNDKANSCVYSVNPGGGDLRLQAYGIRLPRGLGFSESGYVPWATNDGMEMRGSRPVKDDPDAFVKVLEANFGFPDFSNSMLPISDPQFQPPAPMMEKTGYPDVNPLIDPDNSNLPSKLQPPQRSILLGGTFGPQAGAAKFDFIPENSMIAPYKNFRGQAIVALAGDRAPFATGGTALTGPPAGYRVVSVNLDTHKVTDFINNTRGLPASKIGGQTVALERPCDVKLAPDGSLYILDMGVVTMKNGEPNVKPRTGRIFRLVPIIEPERPTTQPAK